MLILKGEKIGIIGGNGTGKSTFIKLLLDELQSEVLRRVFRLLLLNVF
jgi:ATPase subunit of ABC transporter with duplicated ATPase domains